MEKTENHTEEIIETSSGRIIGGPVIERKVSESPLFRDEAMINAAMLAMNLYFHRARIIWATNVHPHKNLMRLSCVFPNRDRSEYYVYYEYVQDAIPLREFLRKTRFTEIPRQRQIDMLSGLCDGVQHLHKFGIVHRDIHVGNILVDGNLLILGDYDNVGEVEKKALLLGFCKSGYSPAELRMDVALEDPNCDVRTDVFSLGSTFIALFTGRYDEPLSVYDMEPKQEEIIEDLYGRRVLQILKKAISYNKCDRYSSVKEFWSPLQKALAE